MNKARDSQGMCDNEYQDPRRGPQEVPTGVWSLHGEAHESHTHVWTALRLQKIFPLESPDFIPPFSNSLVSKRHALGRREGSVVNEINPVCLPFQEAVRTMHSIFVVMKSTKMIQKCSKNFVFLLK